MPTIAVVTLTRGGAMLLWRPLRPLLATLGMCIFAGSSAQPGKQEKFLESDVVIIGAGQAGMAAAHNLAGLGRAVHVLEATDHVGGRTRNVDVSNGKFDLATDDIIEVGGTWLSPAHTAALKLCRELNIDVYNASFVADVGGNAVSPTARSSVQMEESWPWWFWGSDYPAEQTLQLGLTVFHGARGKFLFRTPSDLLQGLDRLTIQQLASAGDEITRAAESISSSCWNTTHVPPEWVQLDRDSTMGAVGQIMKSDEARQVLQSCIHGKNAHEPEEVSFLYNLLSFKGCNSAGPDSQFRVRGGTQAIPLAIAHRISQNVSLNRIVRTVQATSTGVRVVTQDGGEFFASAAIVTGPPAAVLGIQFEPPLPGRHAQLLQRMPMGTSLKFAAVYKQGPWWRSAGLQGDILATTLPPELSLPEPYASVPLFVQCMDHSPFSRRFGVIVCFVEGRQNLHFTTLPATLQEKLMISFLRRSFNDSRAETFNPTFIAHNWADQPFARGAYTGFFPPGVQSVPEYWSAYRDMEKLPNVFFAGADYHTGFGNGYIEGAIRDGQRAASQVEERLRARHPLCR